MLGEVYQSCVAQIQAPNILHLVDFRYVSCYLLSFPHPLSPTDAPTSK